MFSFSVFLDFIWNAKKFILLRSQSTEPKKENNSSKTYEDPSIE